MERIDIYDDNWALIGSMERDEAHLNGHWHKVFHCWVVNPINGGSMLFQLRSITKKTHPNKLDVSSAGHLLFGESDTQGIREVQEELGIEVGINDMSFLGTRLSTSCRKGILNREIQLVHLLKVDFPLEKFNPQTEEVTGLFYLNIEEGLNLFSGNCSEVSIQGMCFDGVVWKQQQRIVTIDDFIPKRDKYYLAILIQAQRLLKNELVLAI